MLCNWWRYAIILKFDVDATLPDAVCMHHDTYKHKRLDWQERDYKYHRFPRNGPVRSIPCGLLFEFPLRLTLFTCFVRFVDLSRLLFFLFADLPYLRDEHTSCKKSSFCSFMCIILPTKIYWLRFFS